MNRKEWSKRKGRSSKWISKVRRFAIYHRDRFQCNYCDFVGRFDGGGLSLDHIDARYHGANHASENLITACRPCNSARQDARLTAKVRRRAKRRAKRAVHLEAGRVYVAMLRQPAAPAKPHSEPVTAEVLPDNVYLLGTVDDPQIPTCPDCGGTCWQGGRVCDACGGFGRRLRVPWKDGGG